MNLRYQLIEKASQKIMLESLRLEPTWLELDGSDWKIHDTETGETIELEVTT